MLTPCQHYSPRARYVDPPPFAQVTPAKYMLASQRAGLVYQRKAEGMLSAWALVHRYEFKLGPWIQYFDGAGRVAYAQPDAVLLDSSAKCGIIAEIKLRHTRDCVKQLEKYLMLCEDIHPGYSFSRIEVCKNFERDECPMPLLAEVGQHQHLIAAYLWKP